jgi:threonine/homoserine/homoserine lactone efflux protein
MIWGSAAALGLAELLKASSLAYEIVRWAGAAYLCYLGARMVFRPGSGISEAVGKTPQVEPGNGAQSFARGLFTNLLNPKVGVFYVSFLPQFIPANLEDPRSLMLLFAAIHATQGILWFTIIAFATERLAPVLRNARVARVLDRTMGTLFIGFGLRLAIEKRPA